MDENSIYALKGTSALYEVLGVSQTATQREIRQAFYRLAVVYHPDKNPEGGEVFKEVSFAHGILSDPEQRAMYDSGTLRSDIEGKARAYDPSMDPAVELSPEDLRAFVDRVRQSHDANRKEQSSFEQRREEEMKRRAEFDARNPAFRADYERARRLRQRGMGGSWSSSAQTKAIAPKPRTSAEVLADLQRKEEERARGLSASSSGLASTGGGTRDGGLTYKQQMMARYRATHSEYTEGAGGVQERAAALRSSQNAKASLPFGQPHSEGPQYSEALDETIRTLTNFDYRTFVEENSVDRGKVDGAILADALGHYDRNN